MDAILEVVDARVSFAGIKAVDGVSLELEPGFLYGLVGPNGSGKTTLVNALSGFARMRDGTVRFGGADVTGASAHELSRCGIARTFQTIRLLGTLTVWENVALGADRAPQDGEVESGPGVPRDGEVESGPGVPRDGEAEPGRGRWLRAMRRRRRQGDARDAAVEAALTRLNLLDLADKYPNDLPYGTQRRVEIARALAGAPRLLLIDEPAAGMNHEERREIGDVLKSLRESGLTQLLIEHDLRMILELCDHLFVMNFGRCVASGMPEETAALPVVREAYLGKSHDVA